MRKVAFVNVVDETLKLMVYQCDEGVYLFGYDCIQDAPSKWDNWFEDLDTADQYCRDIYKIDDDDWILISDPCIDCQHDFIMPRRIKGRDSGKPEYGKFEQLINKRWVDFSLFDKHQSLGGLTGNERLFVTGLIDEFDNAKRNDKAKARQILKALDFDDKSIQRIV